MQLLYFSPLPAASYWQRPHFFVEAARAWGVERILWVEPYPRRLPRWSDWRRMRRPASSSVAAKNMAVMRVPALPIEPLPGGTALNSALSWRGVWHELNRFVADGPTVLAVGGPSRLALAALDRLPVAATLYDAMDDFPEFYGGISRRAMRRTERQIAVQVDLVLASSTRLAEKFRAQGAIVELLPNACGIREFPPRRAEPPKRKLLGYVGSIADWFDWPLVVQLAESVPDADVELIGPCFTSLPRQLPPNVKMQGECDKGSLAEHLNRFSAGLIPFRGNRVTAAVDPIKFYDYRALGLPVLSTNFGEMSYRAARDGVHFLDRRGDLAAIVAAATSQAVPWSMTETFRRENNWAARFASVSALRDLFSLQPAVILPFADGIRPAEVSVRSADGNARQRRAA